MQKKEPADSQSEITGATNSPVPQQQSPSLTLPHLIRPPLHLSRCFLGTRTLSRKRVLAPLAPTRGCYWSENNKSMYARNVERTQCAISLVLKGISGCATPITADNYLRPSKLKPVYQMSHTYMNRVWEFIALKIEREGNMVVEVIWTQLYLHHYIIFSYLFFVLCDEKDVRCRQKKIFPQPVAKGLLY